MYIIVYTVKLGNKEQLGNNGSFSVTNVPVYSIDSDSEQIGISEQFCDGQKVSYCQVHRLDRK